MFSFFESIQFCMGKTLREQKELERFYKDSTEFKDKDDMKDQFAYASQMALDLCSYFKWRHLDNNGGFRRCKKNCVFHLAAKED